MVRVKTLFAKALEFDPAVRLLWLEENCRDDPALMLEVASLLEHDHFNDRFLETPAWELNDGLGLEDHSEPECFSSQPGPIIGNWQIVREISSGGMGRVYLAERAIDDEHRATQQRAAIKIIRARIDSQFLAGRFRRNGEFWLN